MSWGLLWGQALPCSPRDGARWDGIGWDGTGRGWPHALRCPNAQAQGDVPQAAPSIRNCQNLTLFFTCLFCVISYSALKCRPCHFPIYFLAFYISPAFHPVSVTLSAPLRRCLTALLLEGSARTPLCRAGQHLSSLLPDGRMAGEGTRVPSFPPFFSSSHPQSLAMVCNAAV